MPRADHRSSRLRTAQGKVKAALRRLYKDQYARFVLFVQMADLLVRGKLLPVGRRGLFGELLKPAREVSRVVKAQAVGNFSYR